MSAIHGAIQNFLSLFILSLQWTIAVLQFPKKSWQHYRDPAKQFMAKCQIVYETNFPSILETDATLHIRYWRNGNIDCVFTWNITVLDRRPKRFNVSESLVAKFALHSKFVSGQWVLFKLDVVDGLWNAIFYRFHIFAVSLCEVRFWNFFFYFIFGFEFRTKKNSTYADTRNWLKRSSFRYLLASLW